jgi:hypothetical protein
LKLPPGARKYLITAFGAARRIAAFVSRRSFMITASVCLPRSSRCRQEWLHRVWPSATIRRTSAGLPYACVPTRQNVALTPFFFNRSSIFGVLTGSGPSSNVSATVEFPVVFIDPPGPLPVIRGRFLTASWVGEAFGFAEGLGLAVADGGRAAEARMSVAQADRNKRAHATSTAAARGQLRGKETPGGWRVGGTTYTTVAHAIAMSTDPTRLMT